MFLSLTKQPLNFSQHLFLPISSLSLLSLFLTKRSFMSSSSHSSSSSSNGSMYSTKIWTISPESSYETIRMYTSKSVLYFFVYVYKYLDCLSLDSIYIYIYISIYLCLSFFKKFALYFNHTQVDECTPAATLLASNEAVAIPTEVRKTP